MTTLQERGEQPLTPDSGQFGPDYAQKRRQMGPSGCFCRFDNAPQDGDSAGVAEVAHSRHHPAPNARPRHLLLPPTFSGMKFSKSSQASIRANFWEY